jgi:hypothetical protein
MIPAVGEVGEVCEVGSYISLTENVILGISLKVDTTSPTSPEKMT